MSTKPPRPTEDSEQIGDSNSDRSLRLLCQTAREAFVVVDDDRRYVHVNESAAKLFGASADELVGRRIGDFTPPELLPALERIWADFERNGAMHGPYEMARGDGSRVLIEYRGLRNFAPGRHLLAAVEIAAPQVKVAGVRLNMRDNGASLTAREREVLQLAARGNSTREIAEVLSLSSATVKTHFPTRLRKARRARSRGRRRRVPPARAHRIVALAARTPNRPMTTRDRTPILPSARECQVPAAPVSRPPRQAPPRLRQNPPRHSTHTDTYG